jgi:hypothetical protein
MVLGFCCKAQLTSAALNSTLCEHLHEVQLHMSSAYICWSHVARLIRGCGPRVFQVALRDADEVLQLMSLEEGGADAAQAAASLPGRQSGAEAWRSARREAGDLWAVDVLACSVRGPSMTNAFDL